MQTQNHSEEPSRSNSFRLRDLPALIKSIFFLIILFLFAFVLWRYFTDSSKKDQEIRLTETSSKLEKVLKISELSTYQVTFNGVANVSGADNQLLYHVAYHAKVRIGLDMEQISVSVKDAAPGSNPGDSDKKKKIIVTLPPVEIADVEIDPGSLDYIFLDKSANTPDVSITSLPACKKDAEADCSSNQMLFELARDNAVNTVEALMRPFLTQNKDYELEISL